MNIYIFTVYCVYFCSLHGNLSKICAASRPATAAASPVARQITTSDSRSFHDVVGDLLCPSGVRGIDHLRDPRLNKVSTEGLPTYVNM